MKRVNDETERSGRVLGKACIGVVIGLSLMGITRVNAQELDTARTTGAVLAPSSSDSGVCAALEFYRREMKRLDSAMMTAMQSQEVQALVQSAAAEAMRSGKAGFDISLNVINTPDSLRAPLIDALTRGAFDSARAIGQKFVSADDKLTVAQFAIMLKIGEISSEESRPLVAQMFASDKSQNFLAPDKSVQSGTCLVPSPAAPPPSKP